MKIEKLTKEQQFDFELLYKPLLQQSGIGMNNLTESPFELFYTHLNVIFEKDFDGLCNFLASYENNINWTKAILAGVYRYCRASFIDVNPIYFTELYVQHFNSKIWNYLSYLASRRNYEDFLEEYKDDINWRIVSKNKNFSFKELQRYSDRIYWEDFIRYNCMSDYVKNQLINYVGEHIRKFDLKEQIAEK